MIIVLPFASPSLNQLLHWDVHRYKRFRDTAERLIDARLWELGWSPPDTPTRMRVTFRRYSFGRLDSDNLAGGCKPLRDCLQRLRVVPVDSDRWLEARYEQIEAPRGRQYRKTEIKIEPAVEQPTLLQFELPTPGGNHGRQNR